MSPRPRPGLSTCRRAPGKARVRSAGIAAPLGIFLRVGKSDPSVSMTPSDIHRAIEAVWRIESARIIAGLARIVREVGLAEELAQDAVVIGLGRSPGRGL